MASPASRWALAQANLGAVALGGADGGGNGESASTIDDLPFEIDFRKLRQRCAVSPLFAHVMFMLLWVGWLLNSRDSEMSFAFAQLVRERVAGSELLPSEDEVATTFYDITSMQGVQQFVRGPLLDGLFGDQESLVTGQFDIGWVNSKARLVGGARVTQIRVATNSCHVSLLRVLTPTCYPSLAEGSRRRAPIYGENLGGGMRRVYRYSTPGLTDLPYTSLVNGYLPGGYQVDIPARKLHAAAVVDQMERDHFLSIETRAVIIDFNLYNADINTFCISRLSFEHLPAGGIEPHAEFRAVRLLPYEGDYGQLQFLLDGLVITYVMILFALHLRRLRIARREAKEAEQEFSYVAYLLVFWTFWDWLLIILFWGVISSKFYVRSTMLDLARKAPFDPNVHYPLFDAAQAAKVETNLLSFGSLVVFFKIFKYISETPLARKLKDAVLASRKDMAGFLVIFFVVMFAYSMAFHTAFGMDDKHYRGIGSTFMTLMRFVLGDVDVVAMLRINQILGTIFVVSFTLVVFIVVLGIGVAILLRHYSAQPSQKKEAVEFVQAIIDRRNRAIGTRKEDVKKVYAALSKALANAVQEAKGRVAKRGRGNIKPETSFVKAQKKLAAIDNRALAAAQRTVGDSADAEGGGWVSSEPVYGSDLAADPMREAEIAFGHHADSIEQRAIAKSQLVTDSLKKMYLDMADLQRKHVDQIAQAAEVVRALRDENFAIAHALKAKGVALEPEIDVVSLLPAAAPTAQEAEDAAALRELGKRMGAGADADSSVGCRRFDTMADRNKVPDNKPSGWTSALWGDSATAPPPGAATAAALLSLASRGGTQEKMTQPKAAGAFSANWSAEGVKED